MSTSTSSNASSNPFIVCVDWRETPVAHIIKGDVPGVKMGDVLKVKAFDDGSLEISGERIVEAEEEEEEDIRTWHLVERARGKFMRTLKLPENANLEEFEAVLDYGVLIVTVPKKPDQVVESSEGSFGRE